jgi:hypothetical protein
MLFEVLIACRRGRRVFWEPPPSGCSLSLISGHSVSTASCRCFSSPRRRESCVRFRGRTPYASSFISAVDQPQTHCRDPCFPLLLSLPPMTDATAFVGTTSSHEIGGAPTRSIEPIKLCTPSPTANTIIVTAQKEIQTLPIKTSLGCCPPRLSPLNESSFRSHQIKRG